MTDQSLLPLTILDLPNGSVLYHIRNKSRLTRIQAVMRTGSIHEGADLGSGLSHFLEHMLFQGCERYPGNSASDTIHTLGGDCNAYTSFDHTAYYAELPVEKFAEGADIISGMLTAPLFPEEKFNSEKEVIAREADMIFDRPAYRMIQQLWQGMYGNHPAGMPIVGYPDKIAAVSCRTMRNYYLRRYGAMRSHWLVTGDLDSSLIQTVLSEKLAGFARGTLEEPFLPEPPDAHLERRYENKFNDPLTRMALGIRAPRPGKQTPALDLLAGILGGNDSSYLVKRFLYDEELALSIDAEFDSMSFGSVLAVSAVCDPGKAAALEQGIRAGLAAIRSKGITSEDLQKEKLQQRLTLYQQLKNTSSLVNVVNSLRMNFDNAGALDQYLDALNSVTVDEVNAAAEEYLDPGCFVWSVLSPENHATAVSMAVDAAAGDRTFTGKLDSACSYAMIERDNIPMDSLSILLPAGPVWENDYPHGISSLLAKMLAAGPADMPENDFYELLDSSGIDLDVSCGNNTLSVEMSFPPEVRAAAGEIMCRLLANPRLDGEAFLRIKNNLSEQLASKLSETGFTAIVRARRLLFGNHPGGNSRLESVEALEQITPELLRGFYFRCWDKSLVNIGTTLPPGADAAAMIAQLQQLAAALPWSDQVPVRPQPITPEELNKCASDEIFCENIDREQATVVCALAGGFAHKREYYALLILDAALNGLASNLFKEVREKRSLAYSTGVMINCGLVQGIVALHAGVKPENARRTLQCLQDEINRLRTGGLEAGEFASAKLAAISSMARQLESVDARLMNLQLTVFYGENTDTSDGTAILQSITHEECNQILQRILNASPVIKVAAGNIKAINQNHEG